MNEEQKMQSNKEKLEYNKIGNKIVDIFCGKKKILLKTETESLLG
jgi:hypothetical protein